MKVKTSTSSPVPWLVAGLGALGTSIFLGPVLGALTAPLLFGLTKKRVARDIDRVAVDGAAQNIETWRKTKKPGERAIKVSKTIPFGGFDIPSTRHYTLIDDD